MHDERQDEETETLRQVLRHYQVPAPPAEIEDALRVRFRSTRRKRPIAMLSIAASLLAILGALVLARGPRPNAPARTASTAMPPGISAPAAAGSAPVPATPAVAAAAAPRPRRTPRPQSPGPASAAQTEVLLERAQLEMLRQFAREVRGVPEAGAAVLEHVDTQFLEAEKGVHVAVPVAESGGEV